MWTMHWMHGCRVLLVCVCDIHAPVKHGNVKRKQQPDWLTGDIVVAMQERDRHKSQGRWDNYKVWRNKVTDMIQTAKTSFYQCVIEENTRNPRQLWAHLREMCPRDVHNLSELVCPYQPTCTLKRTRTKAGGGSFTVAAASLWNSFLTVINTCCRFALYL